MNIDAKERLAEVVRRARGARSLRVFADLVGVKAPTVQGWERGDYTPGTDYLIRLAKIAGFTLEELLSYLDGKPYQQKEQLQRILEDIELMPLERVAVVAKAAVNRLATAVEVEGEAVDESDRPQPH